MLATTAIAQDTPAISAPRVQELQPIDIDILSSYYQQDGNHSPVTGGIGTEYLTDVTPAIIVNVPLDSVSSLNVNFGMDFYTSASSDRVDPTTISSASSSDTRTHLNVGFSRRNNYRHVTKSITVGGSTEYDVQSISLGLSWRKGSKNENSELNLAGEYYYDSWTLVYPIELRGGPSPLVKDNVRQSFNFSATLSQVVNKRMQVSVTGDLVYQAGLLSTPFHRVYFQDQALPNVEQLPDNRLKYPFGLRLNYYVNDYLTTRVFYRFYHDSWNLTANTFEVEVPVKIGPFFSVYPFYRYHTQTAADYFAPYKTHHIGEEFYTSDYDLSNFSSNKVGLGLRYSPLFGLGSFGVPFSSRKTNFKSIDLRYANYWRSDGLKSFIISTDLGFTIPSR
jgi:hypothetical protein